MPATIIPTPQNITSATLWMRRFTLCIVLAALMGSALAACASPTTTTPTLTGPIHLVFDASPTSTQSVNSQRETLVALDTRNGHVVWKHPLDTPSAEDGDYARYPAVYQNGLVYFTYYYNPQNAGQRQSILEALDAATGQTRWSQAIAAGQLAQVSGPPLVVGSTVYLTASVYQTTAQQGLVAAFDAQSGKVRWNVALPDQPKMPAVANGSIYVLTGAAQGFNARLLALRASDGSTAWQYATALPLSRGDDEDNGPSTAPLVNGGLVFAQALEYTTDASADLVQLAINTRDGSLAWQYKTGGGATTPAISQDGATLCLGVTLYAQNANTTHIVALATANGQTQWSATPLGYSSGCVTSGDLFLVTTRSFTGTDGTLLALNSQDGKQVWEINAGSPVAADGVLAPTVANDFAVDLVIPSDTTSPLKTTIRVASISHGTVVWSHEYDGHAETLADLEGDQLYTSEQQGSTRLVVAYSLSTGAKLWSYTLGAV